MNHHLEVIPLGGVGEFGMNCTALASGDDMIVIDVGVMFPGNDPLGVDVIAPDISFLRENRDRLRAIFLTHGHEDHIGGVSYLINEIPLPIYASKLTLGLLSGQLKEHGLYSSVELHTFLPRRPIVVGNFTVEPIHITHSIPDTYSLAVHTPAGTIIWTGDFKFDQTPIDGRLSDVSRLSELGDRGVLALLCDSTNCEFASLAASEHSLYEPLANIFQKAQRKIIVACFASSLHRVQIMLDLASRYGRKAVPVGRSMIANIHAGLELGYLRATPELLVHAGEARQLSPRETLILSTGSQGEPMSALSRLAVNEFKNISVDPGDVVILSARVIPGNEKLIANVTNHLCRRGAEVYDSSFFPVHVSGHGYSDDIRLMINLTRPRYFIPVHGEYRQLRVNAALAHQQRIPADNIRIIENGDLLRLSPTGCDVPLKVTSGRRFMDEGEGIPEEVHEMVLRDRRFLSEDGFVVVIMRMGRGTGELLGDPELISRGFVVMENSESLAGAARAELSNIVAESSVEEKQDEELFKEILRKRLKRFLRKETGKRPMIIPVVLEI
ncbi:MAG: ribonuclease J [Acidobacteria bacterium]|nr:ribonuclease J [Acidobacteriota bacterium]